MAVAEQVVETGRLARETMGAASILSGRWSRPGAEETTVTTTDTERISLTEDELLQRLAHMVPALRERASETERRRRLPEQTLSEALASGYLGAFRPLRYGGTDLGLSALANGARILAHGCPSSAWTLVFLAQHAWMLGKLPDDLQQELMGDGEVPLIAGALAAVGTATKVDGGYRVSGRSEWNSAIWHSRWASLKAVVDGSVSVFYLPVDAVDLQDIWHTSGMRGTNSDTFVANEVFVNDRLAVPLRRVVAGDAGGLHPEQPFVDYPYIATVSVTCSAVMLGAAEAAVEVFREKMRTRVLAFSGDVKQVDQPFAQMRLGEAATKIRMARALWADCIRQLDEAYGTGGSLTLEERVGIRTACGLVVHTCRDVVSTIMNSSGGSSYFLSADLQRFQRDIEVLKSHAMFDWDRAAQLYGRATLGIPPEPTDLV
jgi:alkylation response protein AidB-like acyl-CoA dehydrogenase